uniref:LIM zinc-binding domain-containing protein n=1 Tax=Strigamia maritima TaxID=126957 RepID=T1ISD3_STRMM
MDLMMPDLFGNMGGSSDLDLYSPQGLPASPGSPNPSASSQDGNTSTSNPQTPTSLSTQEMDQLLYFWTTPVSMGNLNGRSMIAAEDFKLDLQEDEEELMTRGPSLDQSSSGSSPSSCSVVVSSAIQRSLTANTLMSSGAAPPASSSASTPTATLSHTPVATRSPHSDKSRYTLKSFSSPNFTLKLQKALSHTSLSLGHKSTRKDTLSSSTQDLTGPPAAGEGGGGGGTQVTSKAKGFMSASLKNISGMKLRLPLPNRCSVCGFVVAHDKIQEDGLIYHRNCFKCTKCETPLTLNTYR